MRLFKVSFTIYGEPAFAIVNALDEDRAVENIKEKYDLHNLKESFKARKVEDLGNDEGVKLLIYKEDVEE